MLAAPNQPIALRALAADGMGSLFPQVTIYSSAGSLIMSLSMVHVAEGLYTTTYTPIIEGIYTAVYTFYLDYGHTVAANYDKGSETIDVNSDRSNITRMLGLMHENSVFDEQFYDVSGNLLSGRVRSYDSVANATLASTTGLLYQWSVNATYNANQTLADYSIKRVL